MTKLSLCAFSTLLLYSCAPRAALDRYKDAVTVTVDCEDYGPGVYRIDVRVSGQGFSDKDSLELLCAP